MEQELKITVIIPVYNVKNYIEKCVKSVCDQTYSNLEIILVDDGSTDGSEQLCDALASKDDRIKVIHKENGGPSDARNAGVKVMTGEYVGFVDGDDWIEPQMYEKLLKACLEMNCMVSCCRYREIVDLEAMVDASEASVDQPICLSIHDAMEAFITESEFPAIYISVWSKLYHKDILKNVSFLKGRLSEDIVFTTEVLCQIENIAYVDEVLYDYNKIRVGSIMNEKKYEHTFQHEIPSFRESFEIIKKSEVVNDLYEMAYFYFYWRLLLYAKNYKNKKDAYEIKMYDKLVEILMEEKVAVKASCKHPSINRKYMLRLKVFLICPKLYWFLDGLR